MTKVEVQTTLRVLREVQATWDAKVEECDKHIAILKELEHEIRKRTKQNKRTTNTVRRIGRKV